MEKRQLAVIMAVIAALAVGEKASAQAGVVGPNVTRTYDIRELTVRPALIYISNSYLTLMEFDDIVLRAATAKGDVVSVQIKDNYVYLIAQVPKGSTDLLVTVADGRVAMFRVQVDPNASGPRRYVVRFPQPQGEPSSTRTQEVTGYTRVEEGTRPAIPSPQPSSPAPSTPAPTTPTPGKVVESLPPYITVRAAPLWDSNVLTLALSLRNAGPASLVADQAAIRVYGLDDKGNRTVLPIRVSGGGRIAPGGTGSLTVVVGASTSNGEKEGAEEEVPF